MQGQTANLDWQLSQLGVVRWVSRTAARQVEAAARSNATLMAESAPAGAAPARGPDAAALQALLAIPDVAPSPKPVAESEDRVLQVRAEPAAQPAPVTDLSPLGVTVVDAGEMLWVVEQQDAFAPGLDAGESRLFQAVNFALGMRVGQSQHFHWPPTTGLPFTREELQHALDGFLSRWPARKLVVLGLGGFCEKVIPARDGAVHAVVVRGPALRELIEKPALKRQLWQDIAGLMPEG